MNKLLLELLEKAKQAKIIDSFFVSPKGSAVTLYKDSHSHPIIEVAVANSDGRYVDECVKYRVNSSDNIPLQDNEVSAFICALLFLYNGIEFFSTGSLLIIESFSKPYIVDTSNYSLRVESDPDVQIIIYKKIFDAGDRYTPPSTELEPCNFFDADDSGRSRAMNMLRSYAITDWVNDAASSISERDDEPLELEID